MAPLYVEAQPSGTFKWVEEYGNENIEEQNEWFWRVVFTWSTNRKISIVLIESENCIKVKYIRHKVNLCSRHPKNISGILSRVSSPLANSPSKRWSCCWVSFFWRFSAPSVRPKFSKKSTTPDTRWKTCNSRSYIATRLIWDDPVKILRAFPSILSAPGQRFLRRYMMQSNSDTWLDRRELTLMNNVNYVSITLRWYWSGGIRGSANEGAAGLVENTEGGKRRTWFLDRT